MIAQSQVGPRQVQWANVRGTRNLLQFFDDVDRVFLATESRIDVGEPAENPRVSPDEQPHDGIYR